MTTFDRRQVLKGALGVGIGALAPSVLGACVGAAGGPGPRGGAAHAGGAVPTARRLLVVVEMLGGNDGLSMVVPYADPRYAELRPRTAVGADAVLRIDDRLGLHPALPHLHAAGPAVLTNVGVAKPDLSHFEMQRRWWTADPDGTLEPTTGWLGRLCDVVGDAAAPAVGVTVGPGPSTALSAARVVTLSVNPAQGTGFPTPRVPGPGGPALAAAWQRGQAALSGPGTAARSVFGVAQAGSRAALQFGAEATGALPAAGTGYPAGTTGAQFSLAARLLATDLGIRVVHIPLQDDYDTHEGLPGRYPVLMRDLDGSVAAFRADLDRRGLADRVLIMTTSEFGRRVQDNASDGLDHGAASTHLMLGPVTPGLHGTAPDLASLDRYGNLVASVNMTEYYAVAVERWMGVPAGEVLHGSPAPVPGVVA